MLPTIYWGVVSLGVSFYGDVIIRANVYQITGVSMVFSTICSGADQRKHQSCASLAFVKGSHRWPVNSLHRGPVTQKMFPFDDVIMFHMMTSCNGFLHYRSFHQSLVDSLNKRPVMWTFGVSLILVRTSCWTKTRVAGDHQINVTTRISILTHRLAVGITGSPRIWKDNSSLHKSQGLMEFKQDGHEFYSWFWKTVTWNHRETMVCAKLVKC